MRWEGRWWPNTSTSVLRDRMGRDLQPMHKHREIIAPLTCEGRGGAGRKEMAIHQVPTYVLPRVSTATPWGRGKGVFSAEGKLRLGEVETGGPRHTATKREKEFEPRSTCLQVPFQDPGLTPQTSPFPAGPFLQEVVLFSGGLAGSDGWAEVEESGWGNKHNLVSAPEFPISKGPAPTQETSG